MEVHVIVTSRDTLQASEQGTAAALISSKPFLDTPQASAGAFLCKLTLAELLSLHLSYPPASNVRQSHPKTRKAGILGGG